MIHEETGFTQRGEEKDCKVCCKKKTTTEMDPSCEWNVQERYQRMDEIRPRRQMARDGTVVILVLKAG